MLAYRAAHIAAGAHIAVGKDIAAGKLDVVRGSGRRQLDLDRAMGREHLVLVRRDWSCFPGLIRKLRTLVVAPCYWTKEHWQLGAFDLTFEYLAV